MERIALLLATAKLNVAVAAQSLVEEPAQSQNAAYCEDTIQCYGGQRKVVLEMDEKSQIEEWLAANYPVEHAEVS